MQKVLLGLFDPGRWDRGACAETSQTNYRPTLRKPPEERVSEIILLIKVYFTSFFISLFFLFVHHFSIFDLSIKQSVGFPCYLNTPIIFSRDSDYKSSSDSICN